jgi:hypothetical protein
LPPFIDSNSQYEEGGIAYGELKPHTSWVGWVSSWLGF